MGYELSGIIVVFGFGVDGFVVGVLVIFNLVVVLVEDVDVYVGCE